MRVIQNKYSNLAHERFERYNGAYGIAKKLYSTILAAEGHRNYPLREAKCLRNHFDLLLPINPWLENWGRLVATHPLLSHDDRVTIVRQLLRGCDSSSKTWCVPNQIGYYRALHGISKSLDFNQLLVDLDKDCRKVYKNHDMRLHLDLSDEAFSTKLGKQAREVIGRSK
jgi:hypothetical protein